jgi:predicted nucleic acid-binding protein
MGSARPRNLIFDAGALIALEKGNSRIRALLDLALRSGVGVFVPAGVVAQVWRDGRRQVRLVRFLGDPSVGVDTLDLDAAKACGVLCERAKSADAIDASVVLAARRHGAVIVTSDPEDMRRFDASAAMERI